MGDCETGSGGKREVVRSEREKMGLGVGESTVTLIYLNRTFKYYYI